MPKKTFFSFHFTADNARASQVRNMGVIEGSPAVSDNDWESIKKGGDAAIETWIKDQLKGRVCTIVLIGAGTAGRKWIDFEIKTSWNDNKGLVGIYIHNLKDLAGKQSAKGINPFTKFTLNNKSLDTIVKAYDPPHTISTSVYDHIKQNISAWVDEAIAVRAQN